MKSNSSTFFLAWSALLVYLKTHYKTQDHLDFSPLLFSGSFIVLHFTFRSVIHFLSVFNGHIFTWRCLVVSAQFLQKIILFPMNCPCSFCQRSVDYICVGLFLGILLCCTDPFVYSFNNITLC